MKIAPKMPLQADQGMRAATPGEGSGSRIASTRSAMQARPTK